MSVISEVSSRWPTSKSAKRGVAVTQIPWRWLVAMVKQISYWYQVHRQRQALYKLDDTLLKDIGISRSDALQEAEKPFWKS